MIVQIEADMTFTIVNLLKTSKCYPGWQYREHSCHVAFGSFQTMTMKICFMIINITSPNISKAQIGPCLSLPTYNVYVQLRSDFQINFSEPPHRTSTSKRWTGSRWIGRWSNYFSQLQLTFSWRTSYSWIRNFFNTSMNSRDSDPHIFIIPQPINFLPS